jgi:hypothetical protein
VNKFTLFVLNILNNWLVIHLPFQLIQLQAYHKVVVLALWSGCWVQLGPSQPILVTHLYSFAPNLRGNALGREILRRYSCPFPAQRCTSLRSSDHRGINTSIFCCHSVHNNLLQRLPSKNHSDCTTQNYDFGCCIWTWNLALCINGRTYVENVRECGVEIRISI